MDVIFERDSICAGDDVFAPNAQRFTFDVVPSLSELTAGTAARDYLPSAANSETNWSVVISGVAVAKVSHRYQAERQIHSVLLVADGPLDAARVFFRYESQRTLW